MKHVTLSLLLSCLGLFPLNAQELSGRIGSVDIRTKTELSTLPSSRFCIMKQHGDYAQISFDLLGSEEPLLFYKIRHCDRQWRISNISSIEYIRGTDSYELPMPEASRNTLQPYVHYRFELPNEYTEFKVSGNYLVEIYSIESSENPLLTIPLAITENIITPTAKQTIHTYTQTKGEFQQLDIQIPKNIHISSKPEEEIYIVVIQNGRLDTAKQTQRPSEIRTDSILYNDFNGTFFEAGSEYLKFEHLTDKGGGLGIQQTSIKSGLYQQELYPTSAKDSGYTYEKDQNGREVIRTLHSNNPDIDADYHWIKFVFNSPKLDGDIWIEGQCTDYLPQEEKIMTYNPLKTQYELSIPLKMGYHEYQYRVLSSKDKIRRIENPMGNFYQTSNEYDVFVYLRTSIDRYDRLIGHTSVRSNSQ